ncbi:MAG: hypothetical protein QF473_02115 [Planctomycetota bacterium]|jgi:hypothetical protein|nr:hypothetical protein [Planctomycetota bacterium]
MSLGIPFSDPGMLQGGVRRHAIDLRNLQADAFRSASQNQDTAQAGRAFSGANTTNTQTQAATLAQTATATTTKNVTVNAGTARISDPNDQRETLTGTQAFDVGGTPAATATTLNSLTENTTDYQDGDQISITGTDADGNAVSANFKFGSGDVAEVLTSAAAFTEGGGGAADANDTLNSLDQNTAPYVNGDEIDITLTIDGAAQTQTFEFGPSGGTPEVMTIATGLTAGGGAATGATLLNALDDTGAGTAGIALNNTITLTGNDANGNAIGAFTFTNNSGGASLTVGNLLTQIQNFFGGAVTAAIDGTGNITVTDNQSRLAQFALTITDNNEDAGETVAGLNGAAFTTSTEGADTTSDGTTLGELRDFINNSFSGTHDVTAAIDGSGNLTITDDAAADVNMLFAITDDGGNTGGTTFPAFSETTRGVANPNGTTVGELIDFISTNFSGATASINSTGNIVLTADNAIEIEPDLALTIADSATQADGTAQEGATTLGTFPLSQEGAVSNVFGISDNYLQQYISSASASDFLARGAANVAQDQGGDQSGFAKLNDFSGSDSSSDNSLTQTGDVSQTFDVDLTVNPSITNTGGSSNVDAFHTSRFRTIESRLEDSSAQAIFTSGQRQGSGSDPFTQVAVADGASVDNTLNQTATVTHVGNGTNGVRNTATFNLARTQGADLSFRSADLLSEIANNTAINSSAASQEQAITQSGAGGVDEDGSVTENGGLADNQGTSTATNTDNVIVVNSVSMII